MTRTIRPFLTALTLVAAFAAAAPACPNCKDAIPASAEDDDGDPLAEAKAYNRGIYLMVSLLNHGAFSTLFNSEWASNPYNAANGGPLATPADFFTNLDAVPRARFEWKEEWVPEDVKRET